MKWQIHTNNAKLITVHVKHCNHTFYYVSIMEVNKLHTKFIFFGGKTAKAHNAFFGKNTLGS